MNTIGNHLELDNVIFAADSSLTEAEIAFNEIDNWLIDLKEEMQTEEPNILDMYSHWAQASDMLLRFKKMDEDIQQKELSKWADIPPSELKERMATLEGFTMSWEELNPELIQSTIDRQLKNRIDEWEKYLVRADKVGLDDNSVEQMESVDEYSDERDQLEYIKIALLIVKLERPRLKNVSYLDEYTKRLADLDKLFEKILGGRRVSRRLADSTFWWRHKKK